MRRQIPRESPGVPNGSWAERPPWVASLADCAGHFARVLLRLAEQLLDEWEHVVVVAEFGVEFLSELTITVVDQDGGQREYAVMVKDNFHRISRNHVLAIHLQLGEFVQNVLLKRLWW